MNFFNLNGKDIDITDIIPLISGEGIPYKFNNKNALVSMKEFNCVTCTHLDGTIHVYNKPNGLELFLKDINHPENKFEWLNVNKEIQLDLLYLMPRFHGDLLKTYKKRLNSALNLNDEDSSFEVIPSNLYRELRLLNELLSKNSATSYELLTYYYQKKNRIQI
jgi:hypothetical protein